MIHLVVRLVVGALGLLLVAQLVPGITIDSLVVALIAALVLGILHVLVKPILFLLTLPITLITFGLFSFVLNAFIFWLAARTVEGFTVDGFFPALIGSLLITVFNTITHRILG